MYGLGSSCADDKRREVKGRLKQVEQALWFASHGGKTEAIVRQKTGVEISPDAIPGQLYLLTYLTLENCAGFGTAFELDRFRSYLSYKPCGPDMRYSSMHFMFGHWLKDQLKLPFGREEYGNRLYEASSFVKKGVLLAWGPAQDDKDWGYSPWKPCAWDAWDSGKGSFNRLAEHREVMQAAELIPMGLATVYMGVLEAAVRHLKTKGEAGVSELEQGLKQSKLGDNFSRSVIDNRKTLLNNPHLFSELGYGGGAAQKAASTALKAPSEFKPECTLQSFSVQCGHGKRGYVLDVLGKPTWGSQRLLQVISEQDQYDEITATFAGSCGQGKTNCPAISVNNANLVTSSPHKFKVQYKTPKDGGGFLNFVKRLLAPSLDALQPETYTIHYKSCPGIPHPAVIQSFPPFKSWGKVSFGYNPDHAKSKTGKSESFLDSWFMESELGYYLGNSTWTFKQGKIEDYFPKLGSAVGGVVKGIHDLVSDAEKHKKPSRQRSAQR